MDCLHHELDNCSSNKQIRPDLLKRSFPLVPTTSRSLFLFPAAGEHGRRDLRGEIFAKHEGRSSFLSLFCNCAVRGLQASCSTSNAVVRLSQTFALNKILGTRFLLTGLKWVRNPYFAIVLPLEQNGLAIVLRFRQEVLIGVKAF